MAQIKILFEGYAKKTEDGWVANSTCCLIESGGPPAERAGKKIITDPGCNRDLLLRALEKEKLKTSDVDFVFLSHQHPDHILLAGIFENAKYVTFDSNLAYDRDKLFEFEKNILGEDIEIIETPGHVLEHLSLLVDTPEGKVAVAGDVFFWLDGEEQVVDVNRMDPAGAKGMDMKALIQSRKKLLSLSDHIIPGHGKMFKVEK